MCGLLVEVAIGWAISGVCSSARGALYRPLTPSGAAIGRASLLVE
jgi:hypothetical protein